MSLISICIPTYNRPEVLKWTLGELNYQTFSDFDVSICNDGGIDPQLDLSEYRYPVSFITKPNGGPGSARNEAVRHAKGDILLFVGDDTIPHKDLIWRHFYSHTRDGIKKAVQGYTLWHPDVNNELAHWLVEVSGIQSNFKALKNADGSWRTNVNGFGLTTNWSIHRQWFENAGGFDERLNRASYDDIDLSYRLDKMGLQVSFDPGAINWHMHRYTLDSYVRRQLVEGESRITICLLHPEMSSALIHPESLRVARQIDLNEQLLWAKELDFVMGDDVKQQKYARWAQLMQIASLKGVLNGIDSYPIKAIKAIEHVHSSEAVHHILSGVAGIERGDYAYSSHCCGWLMQNAPQNWATAAFCAQVNLIIGDKEMAREMLRQAAILGSGEKWIDEIAKELRRE